MRSIRGVVALLAGVFMVVMGAPSHAANDEVLLDTVPFLGNSFADMSPIYFPQIAQTLVIQKPTTLSEVRVVPHSAKWVKSASSWPRLAAGQYDEKWMKERFSGPVPGRTTVQIWRAASPDEPGDIIELTDGYEQVGAGASTRPLQLSRPFSVKLDGPVVLAPGRYVFVLGFEGKQRSLMNVRWLAQEDGRNRLGGYAHDKPVTCKPGAGRDAYPAGKYYRLAKDAMPTGPMPGTVGFGTRFEAALTKVLKCGELGVYDPDRMIWNNADLDLELLGRR